ncbi:DUF4238 domain-containing protein [Sphingomonas gei]|nr:DUF4238 domain-containing protein [Sphingomonas gei]
MDEISIGNSDSEGAWLDRRGATTNIARGTHRSPIRLGTANVRKGNPVADANTEKFQHFVAKMQLKRFIDAKKWLHVWNRHVGKVMPQRHNKTFGETHLYSTENEAGEKDTWFEKRLNALETAAEPLLKKIEDAARLGMAPTFNEAEKAMLDRFFYTQWKRVPDFLGQAASLKGSEALDEIFAELRARHPDQLDRLAELDTPESRKRLMQGGKVQGLAVDSARILSLFARRGLVILQLPDEGDGFIIGSMPVVRTGQSLEDEDGEAWLPITPRLAIGPGMAEGTITLAKFDPAALEEFNRIVANQSTMFGGPDPAQIEKLGKWVLARKQAKAAEDDDAAS